jgi:hypothetical protein
MPMIDLPVPPLTTEAFVFGGELCSASWKMLNFSSLENN